MFSSFQEQVPLVVEDKTTWIYHGEKQQAARLFLDVSHIPTKILKKRCLTQEVPMFRREYDEIDRMKEKSIALKVS